MMQPEIRRVVSVRGLGMVVLSGLLVLLACGGQAEKTADTPASGGTTSDTPSSGGREPTDSKPTGGSSSVATGGTGGVELEEPLPYACYDKADVAVDGACPRYDDAFQAAHGYLPVRCMTLKPDPISSPPPRFEFEEGAPWNPGDDPDCHYRECCRHVLTDGKSRICLLAPEGADLCCYEGISAPELCR